MFTTMVNPQQFVEVGGRESVGLTFSYAAARFQTSLYTKYPREFSASRSTKRGRTQVRSKRAFLVKSGKRTPIPTTTPVPCNFVMIVSDEIGGPSKLLSINRTLNRRKEGHKRSAAVPGYGVWSGESENNSDVRFGYARSS